MKQQKEQQNIQSNHNHSNIKYTSYQISLSLNNTKHQIPIYLTFTSLQQIFISSSKQPNKKLQQNIQIFYNDFIGYNQFNISQNIYKLTLNVFKKKKKMFRNQKRYLQHYTIFINLNQLNIQKYEELKINLLTVATNSNIKFNSSSIRPKFMIYFNPNAGSNSKKHYQNIIDFISYTNFTFNTLQTKMKNHCLEHLNTQFNQKEFQGVIIISGDGLMHQFVNSKVVGKIPVTHVPAGSGNAFAKYQTSLANQACQDYQAIYLAIKGNTKKLNLIEINLQNIQHPIYSFLSLEWCIMADLDMNSQFLRFLGGLRFQIYAAWRLISMKKYRGKLTYSTNSLDLPPLDEEIKDQVNFKTQQDTFLHLLISYIPFISIKYQFSPLLKLQDQAMDIQKIKQNTGRWQLTKYLLNSDSGNHFDKKKQTVKQGYLFQWDKIKSFRLEPTGQDKGVFGIDGQKYQAQKIQAKISHNKVLTFA